MSRTVGSHAEERAHQRVVPQAFMPRNELTKESYRRHLCRGTISNATKVGIKLCLLLDHATKERKWERIKIYSKRLDG
jgi:hypothetical protein